MNKIAIALSAALSLGAIASANAADATINFTGEIKAMTCDFSITTGGTGFDVTMPTVSAAGINGNGPRETAFNVKMGATGKPCAAGTYKLTFNGPNVENDRLQNTAASGAQNVELEIEHKGTPLLLGSGDITETLAAEGEMNFPFVARYQKKGGADVTNGAFATAMEIFVQY